MSLLTEVKLSLLTEMKPLHADKYRGRKLLSRFLSKAPF